MMKAVQMRTETVHTAAGLLLYTAFHALGGADALLRANVIM